MFKLENKEGTSVAEKLITPTDELSGLPLPIFPNPQLTPVLSRSVINRDRVADLHHTFHPRLSLVNMGLSAEALRACRVQWVLYDDHHNEVGYHKGFVGSERPKTDFDMFKTIVFASAGYVPDRALAFDEEANHTVVSLNRAQHAQLLQPGIMRVDNYTKVKDYLLDYAARKGITDRGSSTVDEFLFSKDKARCALLGNELIRLASEVATSDLDRDYREAKKARALPDRRSSVVANFVGNLLTIKTDGSGLSDARALRVFQTSLRNA